METPIRTLAEVHAIYPATVTKAQLERALELLPKYEPGMAPALLPKTARSARVYEARTHYGDHPVQPMLTWWLYDSVTNMIETATAQTRVIQEKLGLECIRLKIEALQISVPPDYVPMAQANQYWEFHAKIPDVKTEEDWGYAAKICAMFGAHLFWNGYKVVPVGAIPTPVIALRRYSGTREEARKSMDTLKAALYDDHHEFMIADLHAELGILDTKPELDGGWLFPSGGDKTDFLRQVPQKGTA